MPERATENAINAPSQARSRRTMDQLYLAMDKLLKNRSFDQISIADLSAEAGVATGSIYARFRDKKALLTGLYLAVSQKALTGLDKLTQPSCWDGKSDIEMLRGIFIAIYHFYSSDAHIMRNSVFAELTEIIDARENVWTKALVGFTELLETRYPGADPEKLRLAVRIIIRFTTAIMHQSILIKQITEWEGNISRKQIINQLVRFSQLNLSDATE